MQSNTKTPKSSFSLQEYLYITALGLLSTIPGMIIGALMTSGLLKISDGKVIVYGIISVCSCYIPFYTILWASNGKTSYVTVAIATICEWIEIFGMEVLELSESLAKVTTMPYTTQLLDILHNPSKYFTIWWSYTKINRELKIARLILFPFCPYFFLKLKEKA